MIDATSGITRSLYASNKPTISLYGYRCSAHLFISIIGSIAHYCRIV